MIIPDTRLDARDEHARLVRMLFWVLLSGIVAGLILPLTHDLAGRQDADGVLTALISTRKLTWYFWEQDRFLNLIPALTTLFKDPGINLHAQLFLRACLGYLAPLGILVFFTRSTRTLLLTIALANAFLICSLKSYGQFNLYVQHNPFGTSLVLFALAYLLTSQRSAARLLSAGLLCLLAYAPNFALLVFTGPLLFLLMVLRKDDRARLFGFGLLNATAIVGAFIHSKRMKLHATDFGVALSVDSFHQAAAVLFEQLKLPVLFCLLALTAVCLATLSLTGENRRALLRGLSAPLLAALIMFVAISMAVWVKMNDFNIRYFMTAEIAVASVMAYLVALRLEQSRVRAIWPGMIMAVAYAALIFGSLGGFSANYQEMINENRRTQTKLLAQAAVDLHSTVIAGDFWDVWPTVYETQRLRAGDAQPLPIFGAAQRASVLGKAFQEQAARDGNQDSSTQGLLCLLPTVDACIAEVRDRLHISRQSRIDVDAVTPMIIAGKPMLDIRFRLLQDH